MFRKNSTWEQNKFSRKKIIIDILEKQVHKKSIRDYISILKTQQRFKSDRHNDFTEEINMITVSSNDDKVIQSVDLIGT